MKHISYRGPKNIRCHHTKFSFPGHLATGVCAPLVYMMQIGWFTYHGAKKPHDLSVTKYIHRLVYLQFFLAMLWWYWCWTSEYTDKWQCTQPLLGSVWSLPCPSSVLSHNSVSLLQPKDQTTYGIPLADLLVRLCQTDTAHKSGGKRLHIMKAIYGTEKTCGTCSRIMWMTFGTECTQVFDRLWHQNELTNPTDDRSRDHRSHRRWRGGINGLQR